MKAIRGVYQNKTMHWVGDGFPVSNLFSYDRLGQAISPFLLLDYAAPYEFKPSQHLRGVGSHPHRGFETVTIAYQGEVSHKDSAGGGGKIKTGDVQWMTAGGGILHEEFHSPEFTEQGGWFEMAQLWVNLPAKVKMTPAKYQAIEASNITSINLDGKGSYLRVIAGHYADVDGTATTFSDINVWDGRIEADQQHTFNVPEGHNTILVVMQGEVEINSNKTVDSKSVVLFEPEGNRITLKARSTTTFLLLTGEPLNEAIEGYGPFVMNNKKEIYDAIEDFNSGKFGDIAKAHQ